MLFDKKEKEFRPIASTAKIRKEFGLLFNLIFGNHVYFKTDSKIRKMNENPINWNIMNSVL